MRIPELKGNKHLNRGFPMRRRHGIADLGSVHPRTRQRMTHFLPWHDDRELLTIRLVTVRANSMGCERRN
jgi:hypothetical protein